jgi:hypothetical protein
VGVLQIWGGAGRSLPVLIDEAPMEAPMAFDSGAPLTSPASRHSLATADGAAAAR